MAKPEVFELSNGTITAKLTNVGATITSLLVPDAQGNLADVVLGFDSLDTYINDNAPYFGCIVGRVANRIKEGKFALDGVNYSLPINNPPNSLHGGNRGFNKVLWEVADHKTTEAPSITFKYHSKDGEEGYPGDVMVTATYSLPSSTSLKLEMKADSRDKATPINLAQHTYWNLAGHNSGNTLDHLIQIWASQITPVDENSIPTGELIAVEGTPFDFTTEKTIRSRFHEVPGGYDHNYVLGLGREISGLKRAAKVKDPLSSRVLTYGPMHLEFNSTLQIMLMVLSEKGVQFMGSIQGFAWKLRDFQMLLMNQNFHQLWYILVRGIVTAWYLSSQTE